MDLDQLNLSAVAEEGADMTVLHPATGAPLLQDDGETPVTIRLAGTESARFRKANQANTNSRLKSRRFQSPTAEQLDAEGMEVLVKCTLGWSGIEEKGELLSCTPANVRLVYGKYQWLRKQVDEFMGDNANFMPPSVKN